MANYNIHAKFRLLTFVLFISATSFAQLSSKDVFVADEVIWYGLDFSNSKFIGRFDQAKEIKPVNEFELVNTYMPAWNKLVATEPTKFDLKNTFWKKEVYFDLDPVTKKNSQIKPDGLLSYNSHHVSIEQLPAMISSYTEGDKKEGLGLVFVVESFDKTNVQGNFWVVFFDIKSKKILLSEHMSGAPVGIGLRNYWAGAIKHVLADIKETRYVAWKKSA